MDDHGDGDGWIMGGRWMGDGDLDGGCMIMMMATVAAVGAMMATMMAMVAAMMAMMMVGGWRWWR